MSERFDYYAYIASREWKLKVRAVRKRSGNRCERVIFGYHRCGGGQDAVHHLTYKNLGHEPLEDLMAVCYSCHEWLSGKTDVDVLANSFQPNVRLKTIADVCCENGSHWTDDVVATRDRVQVKRCRNCNAIFEEPSDA